MKVLKCQKDLKESENGEFCVEIEFIGVNYHQIVTLSDILKKKKTNL